MLCLFCLSVSLTFQSNIVNVMKKKLKPKHGYCLFTWDIKMQANDHPETALKFVKSQSRKNFHFTIPHRTKTFVSSNIWSDN